MRFRGVSVRSMVLMTALACGACGGSSASQSAASSSASAPASSSAGASAPASASASAPASTTASTDFGVAECDDYFKKYLACVDKLAPAAQTQARQALEQSRAAWKQAASTEQGKSALASTCKAASDAAAPGMRAQGCSW
jgi:hypothetical protein